MLNDQRPTIRYPNPESHNTEIRCTRDNHSPVSTLERHAASDPVDTGSLVLAAHEPARSFSQLGQESFTELHRVTGQLESALAKAFNYDKLNYLMLMMVDPDVHLHVIPRYAEPGDFNGVKFVDSGWSGAPDLNKATKTDADTNRMIIDRLASCWP